MNPSERSRLEEVVVASVARACNQEDAAISLQSNLVDVGLDSLALQAVISEMETLWRCEFTPDELMIAFDARNVGDIVRLVDEKTQRTAN